MTTADSTGMPILSRPEANAVRAELAVAAMHIGAAIDCLEEGAVEHEWCDALEAVGEQVGGLLANLKRPRRWWLGAG